VIFIIGVFLLLLSILIDEGSTLIVMTRGLGLFETNPIFTRFGLVPYLILTVLFYAFIIWAWGFILSQYHKSYEKRSIGYKWIDVFVFFACFIMIFIITTKIELGYNNTELVLKSFDPEFNQELQEKIGVLEEIKKTDPEAYVRAADNIYFEETSYFQMVFIGIMSYLLLKVGHKVCPWENA